MAKSGVTAKLRYRLLTGADDKSFCKRVSQALDDGYELYGSPTVTFNGKQVIAAQAVILRAKSTTPRKSSTSK
jgi:hypothetical protein